MVCQALLFLTTMIITLRFGLANVFKLMATLHENGEMSTLSTLLANVMSQDELLDTRIVKTTFVAHYK